jgi:putative hydrolase of the HAD superfamily
LIKAVIFDLDDTLYLERDYVRSGLRAAAAWSERNLGISADAALAEMQAVFDSGLRRNTFDKWLESRGLYNSKTVEQLVHVYREHEPAIQPHPQARPLLRQLRGVYRLGLLSDGWLAVQQRKLAALKLAPYFDAIVFSDELGRHAWKPSALSFQAVLEKLRCPPASAVYVGDNPNKDFLGAHRAGMTAIWLQFPDSIYFAEVPASAAHTPDIKIASLHEIPSVLDVLNSDCVREDDSFVMKANLPQHRIP